MNRRIKEVIATRFGLVPQPGWSERIDKEVAVLAKESNVSPAMLRQRLCLDVELIRRLAGRLTVHETFFFRQSEHHGALLEHLAARLEATAAEEQVRVWSAGCAGGDEPYSLAIALAEQFNLGDRQRVELLATDVNLQAIERARAGRFRKWSFRGLEADRIGRYFEPLKPDEFRLCDDIRKRVKFVHLSLQEHVARMSAHSLDAILFRNVTVYLDEQTTTRLYEQFARVLQPDGWLLVAGSDLRPNPEIFVSHGSDDMTVFRLCGVSITGEMAKAPRAAAPRFTGPRPMAPRPVVPEPSTPVAARTGDALESARRLDRARRLADQGAYSRALQYCNETINAAPGLPAAYQLRGEVQFHCERFAAAIRDFRQAMVLAERDLIAHYWYVVALQASGNAGEALREAAGVVRRMTSLPANAILSDGKTPAKELLSAAQSLKQSME